MKDSIHYIVTAIVDHPDDVVIDEHQDGDTTVFTIHVHADDMGQVIGKSGRIIRAIRDLAKVIATKRNLYIDVVLFEEAPTPQS